MNKFYDIEIERIKADELQPRKDFNDESIKELAESIKLYGLLQPIIVRPDKQDTPLGDKEQTYTIIAGERRFRASILAGCRTVSARVKKPVNVREISLVENMQRKDLNKIEEAMAIKNLMEEKSYTQEQVATILSKSRPYITNSLRLLNLEPRLQKALIDEKISDAHARVLAGIREEKERMKLLDKIINEKMSVREAERYSKELKSVRDIFLKDILEQLEDLLDNRVYTKAQSKDKGILCIEYNSEKELEKIVESLLSAN